MRSSNIECLEGLGFAILFAVVGYPSEDFEAIEQLISVHIDVPESGIVGLAVENRVAVIQLLSKPKLNNTT